MMNKTAMQQLLTQMREERTKLPIPIEWDRAYQAIEMMIEHTYIPMEKQQIVDAYEIGFADAWDDARYDDEPKYSGAEQYYNETYGSVR